MPLPSSLPYKSQLVPGTCTCFLFILSSRGLMLHKSSTYCQKLMSSTSLIFNMRAISMKLNLALVFILIIAIPSAIYIFFYSYLTITSVMGVLNLGSYHSHHTFSLRCLRSLSWGGCILLYLGCLKVTPKFSTTICTMRENIATDYIDDRSQHKYYEGSLRVRTIPHFFTENMYILLLEFWLLK
jgi:hypothetical protein